MFTATQTLRVALAAGTALVCGSSALAQFASNFEGPLYTATPAGTLLTNGFGGPPGQDAWYNPVSGSEDAYVFTYAGNTAGIAVNPSGGANFEAGWAVPVVPPATLTLVRAQHAVNFAAGGIWTMTTDCTAKWDAAVAFPTFDNISSFSMQPSGTARYFQTLMSWGITAVGPLPNATNYSATGDKFHLAIGHFTTAVPSGATLSFETPGPAWRDLIVGHWYRNKVVWDFNTATILEVSITDLTANGCTTVVNTSGLGWWLQGGQNSTFPLPTDVRLFTGGGTGANPGNISAFDNFSIGPSAAPSGPYSSPSCYANCDGSVVTPCLNVQDFSCFLNAFAAGNCYANCDLSTTPPVLNVQDFSCFLNAFANNCSSC